MQPPSGGPHRISPLTATQLGALGLSPWLGRVPAPLQMGRLSFWGISSHKLNSLEDGDPAFLPLWVKLLLSLGRG